MKEIIAIIGRAGSGKDIMGDFLSKKLQIPCFQISEALKISAKERGIETSRENLIEIGKEFSEKYGDDYLVKIIIQNTSAQKIIITGMRQIGQLEYCKKYHNTQFIGIEANSEIRYKRLIANYKFSGSYEKFMDLEKLDESKIQNVGKCLEYCEDIVENNGGLEDFELQIRKLIK